MESLEALLELLTPLARLGRPALAAIDGRCGSGKSTLAGLAAHRLGCPLFHMDDFFLPPALRTPERYAAPPPSGPSSPVWRWWRAATPSTPPCVAGMTAPSF